MKNARRSRIGKILVIGIATALLASSCSFFNGLFGLNKDDKKDQPSSVVTVYTLVDDMSRSLVADALCTPAEAKILANGANAAIKANGAQSTDFDSLIPVAVGGAVGSLQTASAAWTGDGADGKRIACVDGIVASFVASMNGKFLATGQSRGARDLSASESAVKALLARLAKAAVANLSKSGIQDVGGAASGVVSTMIGSLKAGGVDKVLVSEALGKITQSAVESLRDAGLSTAQALATAVTAISKGAVSAVSSVSVDGVDKSDYASLATQIAQGAASGIGALAEGSADSVKSLVGAVAAGAAAGVFEVYKADATLGAATLASMVQGISSGATSGVMTVTSVDVQAIGLQLVTAVTLNASTAIKNGAAAGDFDEAAVQAGVARGAAAAAQTSLTGTHDQAALDAAITINANATVTVDKSAAISDGIAIGTNHPPVFTVPASGTATPNTVVSLAVTDATDPDSDPISYTWSLVTRPVGTLVDLAAKTGNSTSFTPNVAGVYKISLKVSDGKTVIETFVTINVSADKDSVYKGKTAAERLANAKAYRQAGDSGLARDELLPIESFYPVSDITPEALELLAELYWDMGMPSVARDRLEALLAKYPDSDIVPKARNILGWEYAYQEGNLDKGTELFTLNKVDPSTDGADSWHGLGWIAQQKTEYDTAISINTQVMALSYANYKNRFNCQSDIAGAYEGKKDYPSALAAYKSLTDPKYTCKNAADPSTRDMDIYFKAINNLNWYYDRRGDQVTRVEFLQNEASSGAVPYADWMRLQMLRNTAESFMWGQAATEANFTKSKTLLTTALHNYADGAVKTQNERTWCQLRLGQANGRLIDTAKSADAKKPYIEAAVAAYGLAESAFSSTWGLRPAGEAMVEHAALMIWQAPDYAAAETMLGKVVSTYPAEADQYPRAYAFERLGSLYMERGNSAQNNYGEDYAAYYNKATFYFGKATRDNNPSLKKDTWFFREAARNIGNCKARLKDYPGAIAWLTPLVTDTLFTDSPNDLAPLYCDLANARGEALRQAANDGKWDQVLAELGADTGLTRKAYLDAANYKSNDAYPKNGEASAQAWAKFGSLHRDIAWQMEDYGYAEDGSATKVAAMADLWQKGLDAYGHVTWDAYPGIDTNKNFFYDHFVGAARCYEGLGRWHDVANWDLAHSKYADAINAIKVQEKLSTERLPQVMRQDAECYMQRAYSIDTKDVTASALRASCDEAAIVAFQLVLDLPDGKSYDDGVGESWARGQMIEAYEDRMSRLTDLNWPGDAASVGVREGYIAAAKAVLDASGAFKTADGSALCEKGKAAAHGYRSYGQMLREYARTYRDLAIRQPDPLIVDANWYVTSLAKAEAAVAAFTTAQAFVGAEPWAVMSSRQGRAETWLDECRYYLAEPTPDKANAAAAMNSAIDETMSAIVDDATEVQYPAQALDRLGWAVVELIQNGLLPLPVQMGELADEATAAATAKGYFEIITKTYPAYMEVQWGQRADTVGASAQLGLDWLRGNFPSIFASVGARSLSRSAAATQAALTPLPPAYPPRPAQIRE